MQINVVASNVGMTESCSYTKILDTISGEDKEYIDMENLKPREYHQSIPVTLQQIVQSNSTHQNSYYDLVPISSQGTCPSSLYLGGGSTAVQARHSPSSCVKMEIESMSTMRGRKMLGKRKISYHRNVSDFEDELSRDDKSARTNSDKKQNHSEIEKRRRDKMNTYITELANMVPICHANPRKLDKLTVLRMAVQHLRSIRGTVHSYTEGHYKPAFLSDGELKHLILQAADGFLFVVGCDRGRILFVSESVSQVLNYSRSDLLGQSWFDILHPKDVAKVKEQLSSSDLNPRERLIDSKTMLPVKTDVPQGATRLCPGARRSFLCRMKRRCSVQVKEEADAAASAAAARCQRPCWKKQQDSDWKYSVIQCTGYLKSWSPAKLGLEETEGENEEEACNLSCLVAVGRVQSQVNSGHCLSGPNSKLFHFVSRHAIDGTFLFIDQRATLMLGFLPQELVGTNFYEYFHEDDIPTLSETHKLALKSLRVTKTHDYRLRTKNGSYVRIQSEWRPFRNPWTKDVEYVISKNSVFVSDVRTAAADGAEHFEDHAESGRAYDPFLTGQIYGMVTSHVGANYAGQATARKAVMPAGEDSPMESTPSPSGMNNDGNVPVCSVESSVSVGVTSDGSRQSFPLQKSNTADVNSRLLSAQKNAVRNNVTLATAAISGVSSDADMLEMMSGSVVNQSSQQQLQQTTAAATNEGNDEAAMAVIMSLLEADAGLGGPVDFSGLPWPLP